MDPGSEMPFWKKEKEGEKEKVNYKARLEKKQYLVSQEGFFNIHIHTYLFPFIPLN